LNDPQFLRRFLPRPPARILEVGCGDGRLARTLSRQGYQVVAIDPVAPRGKIFRRIRIEEFEDDRPFDAVVSITALHHVANLQGALERIHRSLQRKGVLVLEEFAYERVLHSGTAKWYFHQRQAAVAVGLHRHGRLRQTFAAWRKTWTREHRDLHGFKELSAALRQRFSRRFFEWTPYLYDYHLDESLKPVEEKLIASRKILATGFRWVGTPREPVNTR
jgi:ubiquinone/menaquinone biosynthesis C-methylase UbiE